MLTQNRKYRRPASPIAAIALSRHDTVEAGSIRWADDAGHGRAHVLSAQHRNFRRGRGRPTIVYQVIEAPCALTRS